MANAPVSAQGLWDSNADLMKNDIADFALSNFAKSLGDTSDAAMLNTRANNWENTFNPNNGLLNARYQNACARIPPNVMLFSWRGMAATSVVGLLLSACATALRSGTGSGFV